MSSAVPRGDVRRPGGATAFAAIHSRLQTSARHWARISSPSPANPSPKDLGYHHRRRDLNAHARRTTDRGDCPRAQRTSESLAPGAHATGRARDRIPGAAAHRAVITITANHPFWGDARVVRTTARCGNVAGADS